MTVYPSADDCDFWAEYKRNSKEAQDTFYTVKKDELSGSINDAYYMLDGIQQILKQEGLNPSPEAIGSILGKLTFLRICLNVHFRCQTADIN